MYKILIVEDDLTISEILSGYLNKWGFESVAAKDFSDIYGIFLKEQPQLVLMDISLPFYNGYYWCAQIRKVSKVPMIFISSQNTPVDMVMAMNTGADDYITKPFDLDVVIAKVNALLRRSYDYTQERQGAEYRGAYLNYLEAALYCGSEKIELTKNEFRIFQLLLEHKGQIVSREELMQRLWDSDSFIDDNTLTVNVTRLRRKLSANGFGQCIETKKGLGYILND